MNEKFIDDNHFIIKSDEINEYISIMYQFCEESKTELKIAIHIKDIPIFTKRFKYHKEEKQIKDKADKFYQNLKADLILWSKNDYKTKFIDFRIAFPLLRRLSQVGETKFQIIFQQEILKEYVSNNANVKDFLKSEGY
ncbi:MAG: hypothetical protein ACFFA3_21310, partial [Promethearchaeota archaeon]